ncbi:hypothetical protein Tco_0039302 [Tanacetum coccineum]
MSQRASPRQAIFSDPAFNLAMTYFEPFWDASASQYQFQSYSEGPSQLVKGGLFPVRGSDPSLVDVLLSKFTMAATPFFTQRKESSSEYLRIKERELKLEDRKRQEQGELERLRIAQRKKELDLQQKKFEFQQQQKFEDLKYYNEDHDHLTSRALSTGLFLKKKSRSVGI